MDEQPTEPPDSHPPLHKGYIPLRYRLPNPPPVFVGRAEEVLWLQEAIRRAPVSLVCGPGGSGKSALVMQALHQMSQLEPSRILYVSLRPGNPAEDLRVRVIRTLAEVQGIAPLHWSEVLSEPDAAGAVAIDLAESGGWSMVLDDLHHAERETTEHLLTMLARYSRRSRWIVTSRAVPLQPELSSQVLRLAGMPDDALLTLARLLVPDASRQELEQAVLTAGGSPWFLQQLVATPGLLNISDDRLLGGLPDGALAFLEALALVDAPLPASTLATFTPLPLQEVLELLERRGLIQRSYAGYRLHDMVRRLLSSRKRTEETQQSSVVAALPLTEQQDPELVLEGLRLLFNGGQLDSVLTLLERAGPQLLERGFGPQLWQLLVLPRDARFNSWRMRCAVKLDTPALCTELAPPPNPSLQDEVLWAQLRFILGQARAMLSELPGLYERVCALGSSRLQLDVGLLYAKSLMEDSQREAALILLESLPANTPELRAIRDSYALVCLSTLEREREVLARMKPLRQQVASLAPATREIVLSNLARVMAELSVSEATSLIQAAMALSLPRAWHLVISIITSLDGGRLEDVRSALLRYEPFAAHHPGRQALHDLYLSWYEFLKGDLNVLTIALPERIQRAKSLQRQDIWLGFVLLKLEYERQLALHRPEGEDRAPVHKPEQMQTMVALAWIQSRVRSGIPLSSGDLAILHTAETAGRTRRFAHVITLEQEIISGDLETALLMSLEVQQEFQQCGSVLHVLDMGMLRCLLLLVLGQVDAVARETRELMSRMQAVDSARYEGEVRFFQALACGQSPNWATLEWLATRLEVSPVAARRARVLLGGEASLDRLDMRLLEGLQRQGTFRRLLSLPGHREVASHLDRFVWMPGWGLDEETLQVWRSDGRWISFQKRRQLWQILHTLFRHNGSASKEVLVEELWPGERYHPLHHDSRLHNAVRKLRLLIEANPSEPTRLLTTEGGYALSERVRCCKARAQT